MHIVHPLARLARKYFAYRWNSILKRWEIWVISSQFWIASFMLAGVSEDEIDPKEFADTTVVSYEDTWAEPIYEDY